MTHDSAISNLSTATQFSTSPAGEKFVIPHASDYAAEYERLELLVKQAHTEGKEIVVVMGLGFVGAVMAAVVADSLDKKTGETASQTN